MGPSKGSVQISNTGSHVSQLYPPTQPYFTYASAPLCPYPLLGSHWGRGSTLHTAFVTQDPLPAVFPTLEGGQFLLIGSQIIWPFFKGHIG